MKLLCEGGFLTMGEHKQLHLTELGASVAEEICERHRILNELLLSIGVPPAVAEQDACRIEHVISKETLEKVKSHCTQRGVEMLSAQPITA
jgi:Mn-dependent DtxR family transcriptional regulator